MDAIDRLRERAQNEATAIALNKLCKQLEAENAALREELSRMHANHPEAACYDVPTWNKLREQLEAAKKDAERYQWLREDAAKLNYCVVCGYDGLANRVGEELDSAIDEAMEGKS